MLGTEPLPYRRLLAAAGYTLRERETPPTLGAGAAAGRSRAGCSWPATRSPTSPVYEAGLGRGDAVLSLNGTAIAQAGDWERVLSHADAGHRVELVFESRGEKKTARVTVGKNDWLETVPMPTRTPEQDAIRSAWLESKVVR